MVVSHVGGGWRLIGVHEDTKRAQHGLEPVDFLLEVEDHEPLRGYAFLDPLFEPLSVGFRVGG